MLLRKAQSKVDYVVDYVLSWLDGFRRCLPSMVKGPGQFALFDRHPHQQFSVARMASHNVARAWNPSFIHGQYDCQNCQNHKPLFTHDPAIA